MKSGYRMFLAKQTIPICNNPTTSDTVKDFYNKNWTLQIPAKIKIHM